MKIVEEVKKYCLRNFFWIDASKLSQGNARATIC